MALSSDFQKLHIDGLIKLYELDASYLGAGILRFHGHQQLEGIIWQGQTFEPLALEGSGFEMRSDGKASAPTLTMANNIGGIQNAVSAYCLQFNDFAGAKLKVIQTLAKYLDAENFSDGNSHASNDAEEQLWYIEQKTSESSAQVSFELSNPIDFEGRKIPVRQITNICHWCVMGDYRGEECGYIGTAMFTDKDEPTDNPALDKCAGRLSSCKKRNNVGSFGGHPASNLIG